VIPRAWRDRGHDQDPRIDSRNVSTKRCHWYSDHAGTPGCDVCLGGSGDGERDLTVTIGVARGSDDESPVGQAMGEIQTMRADAAGTSVPYRLVAGLGDEAIARYMPVNAEYTAVVFRF